MSFDERESLTIFFWIFLLCLKLYSPNFQTLIVLDIISLESGIHYLHIVDLLQQHQKINWVFLKKILFISRKRVICSKSDRWTFDGFQTKPLWNLEILWKLLILKFFFTWVITTHNYFFLWQRFLIFYDTNINHWFLGVTQKNELRVSFNVFKRS